jgi:hypothetical protein
MAGRGRHSRGPMAQVDAAALLAGFHEQEFETHYLPEPFLRFGGNQEAVDPKTGLMLFGPHDLGLPGRKDVFRLGVIGTGPMVDLTKSWIARCRDRVPAVRLRRKGSGFERVAMNPIAYPSFPGFTEAFQANFILPDGLVETLTLRDLEEVKRSAIFEERVTCLVEILVRYLRVLAEKSAPPDVVLISLPDELRRLCTVPSRHLTKAKTLVTLPEKLRQSVAKDTEVGQGNLLDLLAAHGVSRSAERDEHAVFHHGLKARAMELRLTTQIAWQGTLEGSTKVEDDATRAWNYWTGVYYKAGGIPWRAGGLSSGTCYVGLDFYRDRRDEYLRSCMAQAFSDQGEGLVLRSEPFRWEGASRSPHLPKEKAAALMRRVILAYEAHLKQPPSRIVVHKWQRYDEDERAGFLELLSPIVHTYDLVSFGSRGIRFFRTGEREVLRGTMVKLGVGNALLYTRGFIPFTEAYSAMRVPKPIEITEHLGSSSLTQICQEILLLSKMDWNSAIFAGKEPITTAFSEDVGHVLTEVPDDKEPRWEYRYYM